MKPETSFNPDETAVNPAVMCPETAPDSETESLVVHSHGDANLEDVFSENDCETDVEIETADGIRAEFLNHRCDSTSSHAETRAKTRLLSRSHSASDLTTQLGDTLSVNSLPTEPPRRNSSGEYASYDAAPTSKSHLQDIELPKYKCSHIHRNSFTPTSSVHPSPVNLHHMTPVNWRNVQNQDKEDEFSVLLQTTATRVLNRLKSRQQDLGCGVSTQQKYQRRQSQTLQPSVPRKLQPITRDCNKTPRPESDLTSVSGDSDLSTFTAA